MSGALIDEFAKYGITARQGYGMSECSPRITTSDFSEDNKYVIARSYMDIPETDGTVIIKNTEANLLGKFVKCKIIRYHLIINK